MHQDVIARGHAYLGEAFRLTGNHIEAGLSFATAERHRRSGTGDRELEASVCELRAALARDQNDPGLAGRLLEKAGSLLTEEPELERRLAAVLIAEGNALSAQGDRAGALKRYREARPDRGIPTHPTPTEIPHTRHRPGSPPGGSPHPGTPRRRHALGLLRMRGPTR